MAKKNYNIVNTTLNLFKHGKIICKNPTLAKDVISYTQKIISLFKRNNNIDLINSINNIYKNNEKAEITIDNKSLFLNVIRLCISKLCFGVQKDIYEIIQNKIIPIAFNNKNRNGGYVKYTKINSGVISRKFKPISTHFSLELINEQKET